MNNNHVKYSVEFSGTFKKSFKRCLKRGLNPACFEEVLSILVNEGELPAQYKPHKLTGKYKGCWECHIKPDWLLVWEQYDDVLCLLLVDTGTHSDLFG